MAKKIAIILAVCGCLLLAGCTNEDDSSESSRGMQIEDMWTDTSGV